MKGVDNNDVVLSRPLEGPLSTYIPGFAQWTREEGTRSLLDSGK